MTHVPYFCPTSGNIECCPERSGWDVCCARPELHVMFTGPVRTVDDARALATAAHRSQVDKAGRPYIDHPRTVAKMLTPHSKLAVMAGWLHDVVEDTPVTLDQLREMGFPPEVVSAVDSVTWREGESYMDLIRRAAADPIGRLVKLADNTTNSDPARLALLDDATADRLRRKYARAREVLEATP